MTAKKKAIITIDPNRNYVESVKGGAEYTSVDFWGHNEGHSGPFDTQEEVEEQIKYLIKKHSEKYTIQIIDNRIKQEELFA